jgi:dienelactone hydrolase
MLPKPNAPTSSRREFLTTVGLSALGTALPGNSVAAEAAVAMPADPKRDLVPNRANLGTLFPDVQKFAEANDYAYSYLSGRFASFAAFQSAAREKLLEVLLYRPDPVDPRPEVLEQVDCGDFIRERITFATSPITRVPAYVLIPKNLKAPAPAMVDLHSHGGMFLFGKEKVMDLGNNHVAMGSYHEVNYDGRPTATALVRRGYVVITIDACMFGERRVMMDADLKLGWDRSKYSLSDVEKLNQVCRTKEATIVKALTLAGATWPGVVFWDDLRTVDYLLTRPEVDPNRIGCQGVSMGGYRALFLAALDTRIRAACVVGFMSTVRPMIHAHVDTHSFVHFLPAIHRYLDWPDVASLTAPRSLMVLQCSQDQLFPLTGMKESIEKIATVYERAGVKDKFVGRFYEVPHRFSRKMQDDAFVWFDQRLSAGG